MVDSEWVLQGGVREGEVQESVQLAEDCFLALLPFVVLRSFSINLPIRLVSLVHSLLSSKERRELDQ